jgi:hypothetical protein
MLLVSVGVAMFFFGVVAVLFRPVMRKLVGVMALARAAEDE